MPMRATLCQYVCLVADDAGNAIRPVQSAPEIVNRSDSRPGSVAAEPGAISGAKTVVSASGPSARPAGSVAPCVRMPTSVMAPVWLTPEQRTRATFIDSVCRGATRNSPADPRLAVDPEL